VLGNSYAKRKGEGVLEKKKKKEGVEHGREKRG